MKRFHNALTSFVTAVLVMLIGFSGVSNPALAAAPSNSPLSITVTVTHSEDQEGVLAERVYFEVNLSPSPLMLMAEPPTQQRLEGEEIVYQYTAVSTANGPDTYTLSVSPTSLDNVAGSIGSFVVSPNQLSLGVTAASGSVEVGVLEIPVPSDGVSDGSINGIGAGDTVVIHGQKHTVDVVEDEPLEEISVIWLNEAHDSVINVGDLISEAATFELRITGVSIEDKAENALVGMTVTGASDTDTNVVAVHDTQTVVYAPIPAETQYFVRNVTNPNGEGDPAYSTGDQSYYGTGGQMMASAGDELEYIIVQTAGNTGDLINVVMTSTMPLFTTYIGNSTFLNGAPQADASDTAQSALIAGLDVGTIVRNNKAEATFRVIVDGVSESMAEEGGFNQNDWQTRSGGNIIHGPGSYYFGDSTITQRFENILKGDDQAAWQTIKELTLLFPDNPPVMWQFTDPWDRIDQVHLVVHFKKFMSQNLDSQTGWSIEDFTGFLADYNQGNPTPWTGPLYYPDSYTHLTLPTSDLV